MEKSNKLNLEELIRRRDCEFYHDGECCLFETRYCFNNNEKPNCQIYYAFAQEHINKKV